MAFKKILFLHNEESGNSRYFVAGNYDPEKHDIFDWYADPERRAEYEAAGLPSPSAFPSIVNTENRRNRAPTSKHGRCPGRAQRPTDPGTAPGTS